MKVAVISDIHGNRLALEAVLDDIAQHKVDAVFNLGDMVSGPLEPNWVVDILMDIDIPTVRGNHERELIEKTPEQMYDVDRFVQAQMEARHRGWINALPLSRPGKVRVIVQNLVSNAAKFTAKGEIVIGVWVAGKRALVAVRDTGPGIRSEDCERIFDLFEQAEPVDGRRHAGTGIGLHLARALARLMGGELTVDSTVGRGSTFTLDLPAAE